MQFLGWGYKRLIDWILLKKEEGEGTTFYVKLPRKQTAFAKHKGEFNFLDKLL